MADPLQQLATLFPARGHAIGFLDLPAETRLLIYNLLITEHQDVDFCYPAGLRILCNDAEHWQWAPKSFPPRLIRGECTSCTTRSVCNTLIRTCRTVHSEFGPLLYSQVRVHFSNDISLITHAQKLLTSTVLASIASLSISTDIDRTHPPERGEKTYLREIIKSLPSLGELEIRWQDRSASRTEKGTEWKPTTLRRLAYVLDNSKTLCRVFYDRKQLVGGTHVRIREAGARPEENELEFDPKAEYQKWLGNLRRRRRERRGGR